MSKNQTGATEAQSLPIRDFLERVLDARQRVLYSAAAIVRQAEKALEHSASPIDGHIEEDAAGEIHRALFGAAKLIEETTGELTLDCLENDATRGAEMEALERRLAAEGRVSGHTEGLAS